MRNKKKNINKYTFYENNFAIKTNKISFYSPKKSSLLNPPPSGCFFFFFYHYYFNNCMGCSVTRRAQFFLKSITSSEPMMN